MSNVVLYIWRGRIPNLAIAEVIMLPCAGVAVGVVVLVVVVDVVVVARSVYTTQQNNNNNNYYYYYFRAH